jgi:zinc transport system ATP-binding protein
MVSDSPEKSVITLDHVSFAYEERPVLENVSIEIPERQLIGIIGPNGGGKTTLLKLIMGFLNPSRGSIKVFGKPPEEARQMVAYVPQNLRYDRYFPVSVMELVLMGRLSHLPWWGRFSKKDEAAALEALKTVGMADFSHHVVGNLSGGQFQRALIARALVSEPKLLILDEPTANVDSTAEKEIYSLLRKMEKEITILMVTHDLDVAVKLVDRILLVQNEVSMIRPAEVCNHFAMGLYHPPIEEEL